LKIYKKIVKIIIPSIIKIKVILTEVKNNCCNHLHKMFIIMIEAGLRLSYIFLYFKETEHENIL